ncbi:hypothetical protein SELMODRAFT_432161 [Selaginella moellendorffii]|uniref:S-locus glycoprotein domain-containing protein n=1 Tax=Selaginella moellendorffii TaxID=88036 RepID=D8TF61_SELML|nr:hypothetical protein SELMODRAFT_432161 [Selaginella moellendorffii]
MSSQDYALDYDDANVLRRVTLDDNGNLRIYSFSPKNKSGSWSIVWQAIMLECDIFGTCGPFTLCTYRPTKTCSCPPGFHRVDPNNESKGCDYDIPLGACQNSPISVKLVHVNRADYYFNDYNFDLTVKSLEELGREAIQGRGEHDWKSTPCQLGPPPRLLCQGRLPPPRLRVHAKRFSRPPPLGLVLIRRLARDLLNLGDTTLNCAGDCQGIDIPPREVWRAHHPLRYQATKRAAGRELRPKALMELGSGDKECENAPLPPPGEWYFPIYAFHKYMTSELESIANPNPASSAQDRTVVHPPGSRIQASDEPCGAEILEGKAEAPAPDAGENDLARMILGMRFNP